MRDEELRELERGALASPPETLEEWQALKHKFVRGGSKTPEVPLAGARLEAVAFCRALGELAAKRWANALDGGDLVMGRRPARIPHEIRCAVTVGCEGTPIALIELSRADETYYDLPCCSLHLRELRSHVFPDIRRNDGVGIPQTHPGWGDLMGLRAHFLPAAWSSLGASAP